MKKSISNDEKKSSWRATKSSFKPTQSNLFTEGCVDLSPGWFAMGHTVGYIDSLQHISNLIFYRDLKILCILLSSSEQNLHNYFCSQ